MNKYLLCDNMDTERGLPAYPDVFFDLAIIDPPYGIGEDGSRNASRSVLRTGPKFAKGGSRAQAQAYKPYHGNDKEPPSPAFFRELLRVSKNQIVFGANHFIDRLPYPSPCWLVWDKDNGESDFADCELAWTSFKTATRKIKFKWNGMLQGNMKCKEVRIHPNQKPVALYKWILEMYAKPGDLILDAHAGSANSLVACEEMGFEYHAFEIDPHYYAKGARRLQHGIQSNLFAHGTKAPKP